MVFALVVEVRKLRQYFQACHIIVLSDQPLKDILQRMSTSGRMVKWSIELSEFSIKFFPRKAIKAQVLTDFIVEFTLSTHAEMPTDASEDTPTEKKNLCTIPILLESEPAGPFKSTGKL